MLINIKEIYGNKLCAKDGEIGHVKDFYFNHKSWSVRYVFADTGSWLSRRHVLLSPPHAVDKVNRDEKSLSINLSRKQIEGSPSIALHKPVSRQDELDYYLYYGWPAYWNGGGMWGIEGIPAVMTSSQDESEADQKNSHPRDDKHLQSMKAVVGYAIHGNDGEIGKVSGFMVDDKTWGIAALVVDTGHWYAGKEILISPDKITRVSYEESAVFVSLTQSDIQEAGEHEVAAVGIENFGT